MNNTTQYSFNHVHIFNGENYDLWRTKMKTFFSSQNLWNIVEESFTALADTSTLICSSRKRVVEK